MCCHMLPKGVAQPEPKRGMANLAGYTSLVILNHILNPVPNPCPDPIVPCMKTSNCVCLKHVKFHCKMQTCNRRAGAVKTRRACTTEGEITIRRRESDAGGSLTTRNQMIPLSVRWRIAWKTKTRGRDRILQMARSCQKPLRSPHSRYFEEVIQ